MVVKKYVISRDVDLHRLSPIKLLQMIDEIGDMDFEKLLNSTQKKIVEQLKKEEFVSQKDLLKELKCSKQTLITNVKRLEDAGIIFSNRSSMKILSLNPAVYHWNDIMRLFKENVLLNSQLLKRMIEIRGV